MNKVLILLGGNTGDRKKNISMAEEDLEKEIGQLISRSSVYETEAWGKKDQASFLNKVIELRTGKLPREILESIFRIEKKMGRTRNEKWGERSIDIDILFFNDEIIDEEDLKIPHPYIQERRFTLVPLNEIAADFIHPVYRKTINELLSVCADPLKVTRFEL